MTTLKQRLVDWYNAHVVAAWYRSVALYVGMSATIVPYIPDWLQLALDHWDLASVLIPKLSPDGKAVLQAFILLVLLPIAKAWQQKAMRAAALEQAVRTGQVSTVAGSEEVQINVGKG
ncbi:hypothetical protein [Variovorax sp. AFSI2.2]|uniref:hypothetical protein n=1 Tax=Variovorax sp. AFSI2.2 TaxID=3384160 RepID=UPI003EC01F63